jgi:SAM-dependent methyltransferase
MSFNLLVFLKKNKNTFCTPRFKTWYYDYDKKFIKNKDFFLFKLLSKFWFFPVNTYSKYWHNIGEKGSHNYKNYTKIDYYSKILLNAVIKFSDKKDEILDLGCNIGRHLNFLKKKNYKNLNGVDISKFAIKKSTLIFPNLKKINLKCNSIENYLINVKNKKFDIVYTMGATIELVKPTFPLVQELSRVTKKYLILFIDENGHSYPRFWRFEFKINGFRIVYSKILKNKQSFLVFEKLH